MNFTFHDAECNNRRAGLAVSSTDFDADITDFDADSTDFETRIGDFQEKKTMQSDFLPRGKNELLAWLGQFNTVARDEREVLGLDEEDIGVLREAQARFAAALDSMETAKGMVKSAAQAELSAEQNISDTVREIVRRVQAKKGVAPALKAQLGINPRTAVRNHAPPVTPTNFLVTGGSNGVNKLNWNRAGNKPNTIFVIEAAAGTAGKFAEVGSTSATRFDHSGQTPGMKITYRVTARRAGMSSLPSGSVTLYEPEAAPLTALRQAA